MKAVCLAVTMLLSLATTPALSDDDRELSDDSFFKRHRWHWLAAVGVNFLDNEYEDAFGPSTDPLLFSNPPGIDTTVRDWLQDDEFEKTYLLSHSLVWQGASLLAVGLAHIGEEDCWRRSLDDMSGLVEVYYFQRGVARLIKNIIGRERPILEFLDERDDLTPEERQYELEKPDNRTSFYSGSTSAAFSVMTYVDHVVGRRVKTRAARITSLLVTYGFATYVGVSRIKLDKHYLTDVLAGAAAGAYLGHKFYSIHHPGEDRKHEEADGPDPRVRLHSLSATRDGASVMFSIRLGKD